MFFDLPLDRLREYRSSTPEPADFDAFWQRTLTETREHALDAEFVPLATGLRLVDTYDVTFSGFGGQRIRGWFVVPHGTSEPLPAVVQYIGYGGGRGLAHDALLWANAGYAHLLMDTRGQGSMSTPGDTADSGATGANQVPGFLTRGILDRDDYYYRRLLTDAVRAVEAARSHPLVDATRVAVTGGSQGGGMTLAVAGLVPDLVAAMPEVPFLCDFRRATALTDDLPYGELRSYCGSHRDQVEQVFDTLGYFDGVNFAARATAPSLFSVGLMDTICPPSTVFAAYNAYAAAKRIREYPFNGHEGGGPFQSRAQLDFLGEILA